MTTDIEAVHYGKQYTIEQLEAITGKTARTFRRWRDAGLLRKMATNPMTYLIVDPEDENPLKPIDVNNICEDLFVNAAPDVTSEVDEHGGVKAFLEAVNEAKHNVHLVHKPTAGKQTKILVLSDLHCPFHNEKLIKEICETHSDADMVVLNGDIIDAYGASSFAQDKLVTILEEYNSALDLLIWISAKFPSVLLTRGNHDQRVDRYFSKKFDPHMFALGQRDILWRLANGFIYDSTGNHIGQYKLTNIIYNPQGQPWFAQVGKTVFMHPHSYSGKQMQTVMNAQSHLENFIDRDHFDAIVIGHTHKVGKLIERGKLLIEQGCLCEIMDYQKEGQFISRPQVAGYAVIYQDAEGNTNFNDSNFVYCGVLNVVK